MGMPAHALVATAAALTALSCSGAAPQDVLEAPSGGTSATDPSAASADDVARTGACTSEHEPNEERATANVLVTSTCGEIRPGDESDFLTFTLKPTTKSMSLTFDGKVELRIEVDGQTTVMSAKSAGNVPFVRDKPYVIEVRADKGGTTSWRVNLVER